jgi:two-component system NtrC family response regulator
MSRPILVVDDDADLGWIMERLLAQLGHVVALANSGQTALALTAQTAFGVAFVDLKLPDIEGHELVRRLRATQPALPCVLVSGYLYADDDSVQAAQDAGDIAGFIGKPFQLAQVREVLLRLGIG